MRDRLAAWLRRLANRIAAPRSKAAAQAAFWSVADMSEEDWRYAIRREAGKYYGRL